MYSSTALQKSPAEEEDRVGRDKRANSNVQMPPYSAHSPPVAQYAGYPSPKSSNVQQSSTYSSNNNYSSRPSSSAAAPIVSSLNHSPRLGTAASPTNGLSQINRAPFSSREPPPTKSTYYDPTSEHRDANSSSWAHSPYAGRSPIQVSLTLPLPPSFMLSSPSFY